MAKNQIALFSKNGQIRKEATADGVIPCGTRVALQSTGKVKAEQTALLKSACYHAIEDMYQGKTASDAYADGEKVQVLISQPGDRILGLVKDGETIVVGDYLEQTATGTYQKLTTGVPLMIALEAISPSGADALAEMEVI